MEREVVSEKVLKVMVGFDLMHDVQNPACRFFCTYSATYTRNAESAMIWDEFKDHLVVAQIIPFVREFICNITARLPFGPLVIPPTNTHILVKEFNQRKTSPAAPPSA
jgi:hypothetical protein